jgi:hypothetical protein
MNPRSSQWAATSVVPSRGSCAAAQALKTVRFLAAEAPRLPLLDCSSPGSCSCVYKKYGDRRAGARREDDETGIRRYFDPAKERRVKRGRRRSDS